MPGLREIGEGSLWQLEKIGLEFGLAFGDGLKSAMDGGRFWAGNCVWIGSFNMDGQLEGSEAGEGFLFIICLAWGVMAKEIPIF